MARSFDDIALGGLDRDQSTFVRSHWLLPILLSDEDLGTGWGPYSPPARDFWSWPTYDKEYQTIVEMMHTNGSSSMQIHGIIKENIYHRGERAVIFQHGCEQFLILLLWYGETVMIYRPSFSIHPQWLLSLSCECTYARFLQSHSKHKCVTHCSLNLGLCITDKHNPVGSLYSFRYVLRKFTPFLTICI